MSRIPATEPPADEHWRQLKEVVAACLEVAPAERAIFLAQAVGANSELHRRASNLVFQDETDLDLWEQPLLFHLPQPNAQTKPHALPALPGLTWLHPLGSGGMGEVVLAERSDGAYRSKVAVKILKPGLVGADVEERFRRERFILHQLSHPNIARFYEGGTLDDGRPYFVMEYINGKPITEYCQSHQLDLNARLRLFVKVCRAVHEAHRHLIIHRDIKPNNILVTAAGEPKLLDFGIAKLPTDPNLTQTGARFFTPRYAAPEQVRGDHLTTANDVYSLGLLLYELLTGVCPDNPGLGQSGFDPDFRFTRPSSALATSTNQGATPFVADPRARRMWRRALRGDLDTVVLYAVRPDPKQRYASADQLGDDLENYLEGRPVRAQPDAPLYLLTKFLTRHRYAVAATATAFISMVAALVVLTYQQHLLEQERQAAVAGRLAAEREREHADAVSRLMSESFMNADPFQNQGTPETLLTTYTRLKQRLHEDEALKPLVRAELCFQLGIVLNNRGHFHDAESLLQRSLALRQTHGAAPAETAACLEALASLDLARGRYGESMDRYDQAFATYVATDAETAPAAAGNRVGVAISHNLVRNFGAARAALNQATDALVYAPKHDAGTHEITAYIHLETSHALLGQGQTEAVADHLNLAADHETQIPQRRAGLLAQIDLHRAKLLRLQGQFTQAESLLAELETRYAQLFGPQHWRLAQVYGEAAFCQWALDKETAANEYHRRTVTTYRAGFGPYHPATVRSHLLKAQFQQAAGNFTAALAETDRHIKRAADKTNGDTELLVQFLMRQGEDLRLLGEQRRAVQLIDQYLQPLQAQLPQNHSGLMALERTLAAALTDLGDIKRAAAIYDHQIKMLPHSAFTQCATGMGRASLALQNDDFEACFAQLAAVRIRFADLSGPDRAYFTGKLNQVAAWAAIRQNKPKDALHLLAQLPSQIHVGGGLNLDELHLRAQRLTALVAAGRRKEAKNEARNLQEDIEKGLDKALPLYRDLTAQVNHVLVATSAPN